LLIDDLETTKGAEWTATTLRLFHVVEPDQNPTGRMTFWMSWNNGERDMTRENDPSCPNLIMRKGMPNDRFQ